MIQRIILLVLSALTSALLVLTCFLLFWMLDHPGGIVIVAGALGLFLSMLLLCVRQERAVRRNDASHATKWIVCGVLSGNALCLLLLIVVLLDCGGCAEQGPVLGDAPVATVRQPETVVPWAPPLSATGSGGVIPNFPWPPPDPSTELVLPTNGLIKNHIDDVGRFDTLLNLALDSAGYDDRRYYAVPNGFALVTQLERTEADGTPKKPPGRWLLDQFDPFHFSIAGIVSTLQQFVDAPPGYYQVFVFIVTDVPFRSDQKTIVSREQASAWLSGGFNTLPAAIGQMPWTARMRCSVLVYEFVKPQADASASPVTIFRVQGRLTAKEHLKKATLWQALGEHP